MRLMPRMPLRTGLVLASGLALALCVAACDNGPSAVETRQRDAQMAETAAPTPVETAPESAALMVTGPAPRAAAVTGNRRETADDKAQRLYQTNGADFGAGSVEAYLAAAAAFTASPPADAEIVRRGNGDILIYQASTNTFAVVAPDGVVRTMFKPRGGHAYWERQKATAPNFGRRRDR